MTSRACKRGLAVLILAVCLPATMAQGLERRASYSRPAAGAASTAIGGRYTSSDQFTTLRSTSRDVALLGEDRFQFMRTQGRSSDRGAFSVLSTAQLGLYSGFSGPQGFPLSVAGDRTGELSMISGLRQTTSLNMPLPGYRGGLPALNAHLYTPKPESNAFNDFFGLATTRPELAPEQVKSRVERMEDQLDERVRNAEREGLRLFKRATIERRDVRTGRYPNCRDCADNLVLAIQQLTLVRDLDEESYLAPLLLAHAALEREQPMLASVHLIEAFQRNPALTAAQEASIAQYCGDVTGGDAKPQRSLWLEAQMQRYVTTGQLNPNAAEAQLLGAYCAWRLGDRDRARDAAEMAIELVRAAGDPERLDRVLGLATAIQAAAP